ncbi:hypothetical protein HRbin41_00544 [bacterium HR41]|nr:hypothetical protein HRbin41_00544 [bacterium HR41]
MVDLAQSLELAVAQDRLRHHQLVAVLGRFVEQVDLRPDARLEAHHDGLADRVDRRVGDLREELFEVAEKRRTLVGEHRECGVVTHRAGGLAPVARHRCEDHPQVLFTPAEGELARTQRLDARHARLAVRQVVDVDDPLGEPLAVGAPPCKLALDLFVGDDALGLEVDQEQLARAQAPLGFDVRWIAVENARLGGDDDPAVACDEPASRAQTVAVERRPDHAPVGERHRCRPVPGLDQRLVVGVEITQLGRGVGPLLVRLGDQHRDRVGGRAAAQHQQLEDAVERRRVREILAEQTPDLLDVVAEQRRGKLALARPHPVAVAAQGVDLAVVGEHAVGVGELPAREGVGGEARVHDRQPRHDARVAQVGVEARQLGRGQHPLVDDRPRRERRDRQALDPSPLDHPADHVEAAFESVLIADAVVGGDEELLDARGASPRVAAARVEVDRHGAPAEHVLTLVGDGSLEHGARLLGAVWIARQEAHRDAVAAGRGQLERQLGAQESVGYLQKDPGTVAGLGVGASGAAVLEPLEGFERALDHLVRSGRAQACDERDAASVVLVCRVVQPAGGLVSCADVHRGGGLPLAFLRGQRGQQRVPAAFSLQLAPRPAAER